MGRCMNAFIFSVVLLAGIGILAALALGAYFALQPKPETPRRPIERQRFRLPSDALKNVQPNSHSSLAPGNATTSTKFVPTTTKTTESKLVSQPPPEVKSGQFGPSVPKVYSESDQPPKIDVKVQSSSTLPRTTTSTSSTPTTTRATVRTTTKQPDTTKKPKEEFAHLVLPEDTENFISGEVLSPEKPVLSFPSPEAVNWSTKLVPPQVLPPRHGPPPPSSPSQTPEHSEQPQKFELPSQIPVELNPRVTVDTKSRKSQGPDTALEKHLLGYQKIAGISYRNGYLYVPSYVNGRVSVLSTPDMNTLIEYACAECSIYDIAALSTGDMVAALGRNQKLVKIDPLGNEIKRLSVGYATKGLAINGYNEIFVLSRSHKEVYVYNKDLEQLAVAKIPGKGAGDCNFMAVNDSDVLFVSCQEAVYVFTVNGEPLMKILPPRGVSYGVGMDIDADGNILVVRRGQGILDVYDRDGNYLEAVGEGVDTLWSDIAVGEEHLYVVDYIDAKIKVFRYN